MQITTLAKEVQPYVVEMRRYFHQHPELSNREDKTIQRIAQELTDMDIPYEEIPKGVFWPPSRVWTPERGKPCCCGRTSMPCRCKSSPATYPSPGSAKARRTG